MILLVTEKAGRSPPFWKKLPNLMRCVSPERLFNAGHAFVIEGHSKKRSFKTSCKKRKAGSSRMVARIWVMDSLVMVDCGPKSNEIG